MASNKTCSYLEVFEKMEMGVCLICDKLITEENHYESAHKNIQFFWFESEEEEELKQDGLVPSSATSSLAPKISGDNDAKKSQVGEDNVSDSVSNPHQTVKEEPIADLILEPVDEQRANDDAVTFRSRSCFNFILSDLHYEFTPVVSTGMVPSVPARLSPPPKPPDMIAAPSSSLNCASSLTTTPKLISMIKNHKFPSSSRRLHSCDISISRRHICIAPPSHFLPSDLHSLGSLRCFDPGGPLSPPFLPLPPVSTSDLFPSDLTSIVKGSCGVELGFACQNLLIRVEAAGDSAAINEIGKVRDSELLGRVVRALARTTQGLEGDICAVARLVLGLSTSISAVYIAGELEGVNLNEADHAMVPFIFENGKHFQVAFANITHLPLDPWYVEIYIIHVFDLLADWIFEYCDCMLWAWSTIEHSKFHCSKSWLTNDVWKSNFKNWFGLCCANEDWFELIETRIFVALNAIAAFETLVNALSYEASRFIELCDCELQKEHGLIVVDTRLGFIVDLSIATGDIASLLNGKWAKREVQGVPMEKDIRRDIRATRLMRTLQLVRCHSFNNTAHALNEFDPKYSTIDWRLKLEIQRGAFNIYDLEEVEAVLVDAGTGFIYWFVVTPDFFFQFQQASKGGFSDTSTLTNFEHHACWLLPILALVDEIYLDVGAKLQVLLTKEVALEITERCVVVQGMPLVQASDRYFWLGQPQLMFPLTHIALSQNAFQITYILWIWYCFEQEICFCADYKFAIIKVVFWDDIAFLVMAPSASIQRQQEVLNWLLEFSCQQGTQLELLFKVVFPNDERGSLFVITLECQICYVVAIFHRKMIDRGRIHDHLVVIKWKTLLLRHDTWKYSSLRTMMFSRRGYCDGIILVTIVILILLCCSFTFSTSSYFITVLFVVMCTSCLRLYLTRIVTEHIFYIMNE